MGKLCRRCLGINDATPGILIDKAMDLMGETLVSEVGNQLNLFIYIFSRICKICIKLMAIKLELLHIVLFKSD